ncbi:MAG: putative metal-binding motif-containing protein [Alphaproteobacteria bacterium]|nr:putative metal-binding motif-containing protein [Alphaproteobacteria bacterium]
MAAVGAGCATSDDADGDGFLAPEDCDDSDPLVHPDAEEVCDGIDNDCDNLTDDPSASNTTPFYLDEDGDGWGVLEKDRNGDGTLDSGVVRTCVQPLGFAPVYGDCDDDDAAVNPDDGGCD